MADSPRLCQPRKTKPLTATWFYVQPGCEGTAQTRGRPCAGKKATCGVTEIRHLPKSGQPTGIGCPRFFVCTLQLTLYAINREGNVAYRSRHCISMQRA